MKNPINEMTRQINPSMRKSHCLDIKEMTVSFRFGTRDENDPPSSLSSNASHLQ